MTVTDFPQRLLNIPKHSTLTTTGMTVTGFSNEDDRTQPTVVSVNIHKVLNISM